MIAIIDVLDLGDNGDCLIRFQLRGCFKDDMIVLGDEVPTLDLFYDRPGSGQDIGAVDIGGELRRDPNGFSLNRCGFVRYRSSFWIRCRPAQEKG